jgi:hypothetical protein
MIGKCESCGTSDVEVTVSRENGKEKQLCNQCRPQDGAYGYWWILVKQAIFYMYFLNFFYIVYVKLWNTFGIYIEIHFILNLTNLNFSPW